MDYIVGYALMFWWVPVILLALLPSKCKWCGDRFYRMTNETFRGKETLCVNCGAVWREFI